jgi:hypothetical protein
MSSPARVSSTSWTIPRVLPSTLPPKVDGIVEYNSTYWPFANRLIASIVAAVGTARYWFGRAPAAGRDGANNRVPHDRVRGAAVGPALAIRTVLTVAIALVRSAGREHGRERPGCVNVALPSGAGRVASIGRDCPRTKPLGCVSRV